MKIRPVYQKMILSLPEEPIRSRLNTASRDEFAVLFAVYSEPEFTPSELAARLEMTESVFRRALNGWKEAGALRIEEEDRQEEPKPETVPEPQPPETSSEPEPSESEKAEASKNRVQVHTTLPHYTSDEVAGVIERRHGCSELLDSCQQILGKVFSSSEVEILVGLVDHLALPHDYILLLCSYCAAKDKRSLRYIQKLAVDFFDRDILTYAALDTELRSLEARNSLERYVRTLFGLGSRALIKKEKAYLAAWGEKYGFSRELIQKAYELSVSRTKEANMSYANGILEKWYAAGLKTPEEVDAAEGERNQGKEEQPPGSSFSTDEFYEAALRRSYGDLMKQTGQEERSTS